MDQLTTLELDGVRIQYPVCYDPRAPMNMAGDIDYSAISIVDAREYSAFVFSVSRFPGASSGALRNLKAKLRPTTCTVSTSDGWEIAICESDSELEFLSADVVGDTRAIHVGAILPSHLRGTELGRFVHDYFGQVVDQICVSMAGQSALPDSRCVSEAI